MSNADPSSDEKAPPRRRRQRRPPTRSSRLSAWLRSAGADLGVLLLLAGALALLLQAVLTLRAAEPDRLAPTRLLFGILLLALAVALGLLRLRRWINGVQRWWVRRGCPHCHSAEELHRVRRHAPDRLIGWTGIPLRRYYCSNCKWEGVRIDESRT